MVKLEQITLGTDRNCSASYLRQTIMLSPYETPEFRHLFNDSLKNVGGKKRIEGSYSPVQVPEGVSQVRIMCLFHTALLTLMDCTIVIRLLRM